MEFRGENFLSDLCGREDNKAEPVLENKFLSDLCGREDVELTQTVNYDF